MMEKWRERSGLIVLLIVQGAFLIGAQNVFEEVKQLGTDVILVPKYTGDPSEINWKVNDKKLVDMDRRPQVDISFYLLQGRANISDTDGSLTITKLTKEDSGVYIAEALVNNRYQYTSITLTVLPVPETPSTKTTEQPDPEQEPSGPSGGIIALIVILVLILIIVAIIALWYCYFRDKKSGTGHIQIDPIRELGSYIKVIICTDGLSSVDESRGLLADHSKRIQNLCVTLFGVKPEDYGNYIVEALLSNGKKSVFPIKETDDVVNIKPEGDIVTLAVPDTENVTMLVWKKDGVPQSQWTGSDLLLYANDITLGPGSVTVNNAEGRKVFKVNFQLEERQPIGSVTFHPFKMTGKTQITWKKDGQPVNIGGNRIQPGPNGDLTINNVTSEDKGKYTVQCNDKKLDQEFFLQS